LFPGVSVAKNAKVENSILFFDSVVESGASVLKTLSDNEVFFGKECEIGKGEEVPNQNAPDILSSGITLIGRGTKIPEKQVIGKNCIISPGLRQSDFVERKIDSGKDL
jgi:glucose-1-phosphate adenylyltransferase